jgi:hypothetical protein
MRGRSHEAVDGACTSQGNIELMPKKQVLDFKPAPRLEQVGDGRSKQMEDVAEVLGTACPLSGRNSTYRPVQILEAGSGIIPSVPKTAQIGRLIPDEP